MPWYTTADARRDAEIQASSLAELGYTSFNSMRQCADAWWSVAGLLDELVPDWKDPGYTRIVCATRAIRALAAGRPPESP